MPLPQQAWASLSSQSRGEALLLCRLVQRKRKGGGKLVSALCPPVLGGMSQPGRPAHHIHNEGGAGPLEGASTKGSISLNPPPQGQGCYYTQPTHPSLMRKRPTRL